MGILGGNTAEKKLQKLEAKVKKVEEKQGRKPELKRPKGTEDSTLKRTTGDAAQEKYRITYEARHLLKNYLNGEDPVGLQWQGALVVKGAVHCRLSNITPEGTWKESEKYVYGGRNFKREAGKCAGRVMMPWRELRERRPEWFEDLEVYCQPAAVVDSIIMKWMLEEQAEAFPCSIWCRDMLAAGQAMQTKVVQAAAQQLGSRVYGGVTCLVQVTDTDYSWSFKGSVAQAQAEVRKVQVTAAKAKGVKCTLKCGPAEIMKIIHEAQQAQKRRAAEADWLRSR